jgi:hypothetical protein
MSQFETPQGPGEGPNNEDKNTEETRPIGRAGEDEAPHSSDHKPPVVTPERANELTGEEAIIDALIKFDCHDPNTTQLLNEWEKALREKLYIENLGKITDIDNFVHKEFQKQEKELFDEALNGIHDEKKWQELKKFIEEKRKI